MDRFDPFVKYADVYGDIINWEKDPMNRPENQNKYFFSDGKTYYEQLLRIMRLVSVFKQAFNQIYTNEDEISSAWENFVDNLTATAVAGEEPSVELVWNDDSVSFNFTMPRGLPGPEGPQGVSIAGIAFNQDYTMTITLSNGQTYTSSSLRGPEGPEGSGLEILDVYPTLADLQTAHPTGSPGDANQVGSGSTFTLYIWSSSQNAWVNAGTLSSPSPSSSLPSMDGTASAGSSMLYARGDHIHPSDTTKLDKSNTNGVYAVSNGSQTMMPVSDVPAQGALMKWGSSGALNADQIEASNIETEDLTASGNITADTISVTNNNILNSSKLDGIAGSSNAYQLLSTVSANMDVLGMGFDSDTNTPTVSFYANKWGNNGQSTSANANAYFTDSFIADYTSYSQGRIGLAPASDTVLGGVKVGTGLRMTSSNRLENYFTYLNNVDLGSGNTLSSDVPSLFVGYAYNCTNRPAGSAAFGTLIVMTGGGRQSQIYMSLYKRNTIWYRRYYGNVWGEWTSITMPYVAGDTVTISNTLNIAGCVTGAQKKLNFTIPLDRPHEASAVSFTHLKVLIRGISGYVLGQSTEIDLVTDTNYSVSSALDDYGIYINVDCTNAVTATNNTPITVDVRSGTSFTFA